MREVRLLRRQDEELCQRLAMDPFYVSSTTVPTTQQMNDLKVSCNQSCGSGMFIPGPESDFFSIPDPGSKSDADPGSASKNLSILTQRIVSKLSEI
jgi:hypothetical protein